ncbi:hypothetical protein T265_11063 [Opisthorchis viverrini]|uniref:Uncharacterized protein n=1 Tax=Opisthorchis viverrini TaxID=6198 RepID=A0A074Z4C1_OPIVI|nr:hypothetical protein T265_11063 [Opisthorchis viverrini]KER20367.1 hypothetical protein T265_11063 [Opisthorchis viverrini]
MERVVDDVQTKNRFIQEFDNFYRSQSHIVAGTFQQNIIQPFEFILRKDEIESFADETHGQHLGGREESEE